VIRNHFWSISRNPHDFALGWRIKAQERHTCHTIKFMTLDDFLLSNLTWAGLAEVMDGSNYKPETFNHFRFRRVFAIRPVGNDAGFVCHQSEDVNGDVTQGVNQCDAPHWAILRRFFGGFGFICDRHGTQDLDYAYWLRQYHGIRIDRNDLETVMEEYFQAGYDLQEKFMAYTEASCNSEFELVRIQHPIPNSVQRPCIKPGFYNSLYSVHGWEILNFRYSDDGKLLEGTKIKGDPNVPAGKVSVRVFLTKPVKLTPVNQVSMNSIRRAIEHSQQTWTDELNAREDDGSLQPFRIPPGCSVQNDDLQHPKFCRWCYFGECQVAETGFTDPRFADALFYAFDDDTFAILWLEFRAFFHYFRVTDTDDM